jgi:DNA-binding NarL/FixJ family response regulator
MTAVLVVEDQQVLASALEIAIGAQSDLDCVGAAGTVDEALARMAASRPDVVLMDIELPGADGIAGTRRIKAAYPDVRVLILTGGTTPGRLADAAAAGAGGFLGKDSALPDILAAIRNPMPGKMVIEGTTLSELLTERPAAVAGPDCATDSDLARFTAREREVLALMGEGLDPAAIAERLVVSVYTARGHVKNVMMKLGAHTQLEAVVLATRAGLLPPAPGSDTAQRRMYRPYRHQGPA